MKNGIFYAILTAVLFVTLEPVSKLIASDVNPYAITFWRFLVGSILLLPPAIMKLRKNKIKITAKDLGLMSLLGIVFVCISMLALQLAVKVASAPSLIAIIFSSNSLFTVLFSLFFNKEKLNRNKIIALALGVVGLIILCTDQNAGTSLSSALLAILASVSFSLYTSLGNKHSKKFGGIIQTAIVFLTGSIVLLIVLLFTGVDISLSFEPKTLSILLYLGIFVTGVGYWSYFKAIEKGGSIMASLTFFIKPILTPFVTLFINGIMPDLRIFVSVAFILVAAYFATHHSQKSK